MNIHPFSYDDLLDYLANQLTNERTVELEEHLRSCPRCAKTIARFQVVRSCLRTDDSVDPPPRALARAKALDTRLRPAPRQSRIAFNFRPRALSFAGGFAAALVLLFCLSVFIANQDISEDSILYPAKLTVQGLQVRLAYTGQQLGIGTSRTATASPAAREPSAKPAPPSDIVISQVYGGGGNTGAIFTHDFIELFNRGTTTISLAGWSLQYASASGTSNFGAGATLITELPNISLAPGQYLLIQEARGNAGTSPLPNPDVIDPTPIALSATEGKIALVNTSAPLGCNGGKNPCLPGVLTNIVDLMGYGEADFFLGWGTAPAGTNTAGILRLNNGCKDTRSNAEDFTVGAPNPRNSASARVPCPTVPPKP